MTIDCCELLTNFCQQFGKLNIQWKKTAFHMYTTLAYSHNDIKKAASCMSTFLPSFFIGTTQNKDLFHLILKKVSKKEMQQLENLVQFSKSALLPSEQLLLKREEIIYAKQLLKKFCNLKYDYPMLQKKIVVENEMQRRLWLFQSSLYYAFKIKYTEKGNYLLLAYEDSGAKVVHQWSLQSDDLSKIIVILDAFLHRENLHPLVTKEELQLAQRLLDAFCQDQFWKGKINWTIKKLHCANNLENRLGFPQVEWINFCHLGIEWDEDKKIYFATYVSSNSGALERPDFLVKRVISSDDIRFIIKTLEVYHINMKNALEETP